MFDSILLAIRDNFQVFNWWLYILSAFIVLFATWRLFKRQSFFVLVLILLLEIVLFFTFSATAEPPYHLAPTLMIVALLILSVGIKPAFSYILSLLINLALAVAAAFLLEFMRKYLQRRQVEKDENEDEKKF